MAESGEERHAIVADYSEFEGTGHRENGVAELQFLSVKERRTLFEPPSLTLKCRNCFGTFLSLVQSNTRV